MTQRIFDIENEKDIEDLWNILPDWVALIKKADKNYNYDIIFSEGLSFAKHCCILKINWHDKTEITRPLDYKSMIGYVGWFWDNDDDEKSLGILTDYCPETVFPFVKGNNDDTYYNFRPAKKSELRFWGED